VCFAKKKGKKVRRLRLRKEGGISNQYRSLLSRGRKGKGVSKEKKKLLVGQPSSPGGIHDAPRKRK